MLTDEPVCPYCRRTLKEPPRPKKMAVHILDYVPLYAGFNLYKTNTNRCTKKEETDALRLLRRVWPDREFKRLLYNHDLILVYYADRLASCLQCTDEEVKWVAVAPKFESRNLSRAMVLHAIYSRTEWERPMRVVLNPATPLAHLFYTRLGFE
jgi:GNAT superfamily N-acetyltransferase